MTFEEARAVIRDADEKMARLFEERMAAAKEIGLYKKAQGVPVRDSAQEEIVRTRNLDTFANDAVRHQYASFIDHVMALSRDYQEQVIAGETDASKDVLNITDRTEDTGKQEAENLEAAAFANVGSNRYARIVIPVHLRESSYDVVLSAGGLAQVGEEFDLHRKVLVVTDEGVPSQYANVVANASLFPILAVLPQGEASKTKETLSRLLSMMLDADFTRQDCVVAVGGGICTDVAGLTAALYMRGIDYYSVPTTLLAQVDSSVGGKTGVNLDGIKNVIGTFYQPKKVLVDPETLKTLSPRLISAGLAESVKMAVTLDSDFFAYLEHAAEDGLFEEILRGDADAFANNVAGEEESSCKKERQFSTEFMDCITNVIEASLRHKVAVVEQDEKEAGLRRVLNFGHTIGHGIESCTHGALLHGECVALGMLPMCGEEIRPRVKSLLQKLGLPTEWPAECQRDKKQVKEAIRHDKKTGEDGICVVKSKQIGSYFFELSDGSCECADF